MIRTLKWGCVARLSNSASACLCALCGGTERIKLFEAILHIIASARPELGVIRLRVLPVFCDRRLGPPEGLQYESRVLRCESAGAAAFTADLHSADPRLWLRHHVAYDLRDALRRVVERLAPSFAEDAIPVPGHSPAGEFIRRLTCALRSPQARDLGEHLFAFALCAALQELLEQGGARAEPQASATAVLEDLRRELPALRPMGWPLGHVVNHVYDAPREAGYATVGVSTCCWDPALRR